MSPTLKAIYESLGVIIYILNSSNFKETDYRTYDFVKDNVIEIMNFIRAVSEQ
jgi:hypothetical protein